MSPDDEAARKRQRVAKPAAARRQPAVTPVVKAAAQPVRPAVKESSPRATPTPKVTPAKPAKPAKRARPAAPRRPAATGADATAEAVAASRPMRRATAVEAPVATAPAVDAAPPEVPEAVEPALDDPQPLRVSTPRARPFGRSGASGDVIGEAEERDPDEPVVPLAPARPGLFDELFEEPDPTGRRPLPVRVVRGDWRPALTTALPALAVTLAAAAFAAISLLTATEPRGNDKLLTGTTTGRWLRYVCALVAQAFGAPVSASAEFDQDFGFEEGRLIYVFRVAPLTVTLAGLVALWFFGRRARRYDLTPDRVAEGVRVAVLYAVPVTVLALLARWEGLTGDESEFAPPSVMTFTAHHWKALFWAALGAFVASWLASGALRWSGRAAGWLLAVRGALVGLGAGIGASLLLTVVLGYVYAGRVGGESADVTAALPGVVGVGVSLGTAMFGVLSGGLLRVPFGEPSTWSLWVSSVPKPYLLLLVVPVLAVAAGARYVTTRDVPAADAVTACGRMAAPAGVVWLLLAIAGTVSTSQSGGFGAGRIQLSAGPVLWNALLVTLWFGAGGWVAGRLLVRRRAEPPVLP